MASLVLVQGESPSGNYFPIKRETIVIGRDEGCDIQILDEMVSRRHLEVRHEQRFDNHVAADLESSNGVFVNGRQIQKEAELQDGDTIRIGESKLFYSTKDFRDLDAAMTDFKKRGEHGKSTLIK